MTSKVGTASILGEIRHTQDLIAAVAIGKIRPGHIPPEIDSPSVRALVAAIVDNPHKNNRHPYATRASSGGVARFIFSNANSGFAPPLHQLPGPKGIEDWMRRGKLHAGTCKACGAKIIIVEVSVGGKFGFLAIEDGEVRLANIEESDFLPTRRRFDPKEIFGAPKRR